MSKKNVFILASAFLLIFGITSISFAKTGSNLLLTTKQRAIIPIAAFTAQGDMEKLSVALNDGLDAGLTINETKEVLVHIYAYAGFPRSLNGINNLMNVIKDRAAKGIKDELGRQASPIRTDKSILELGTANQTYIIGRPAGGATYEFSPEIDRFLKIHLFGDIFERDILDFKTREIITVAILASIGHAENQLRSHMKCSINIGITKDQLCDLINVLREKVGSIEADTATIALNTIVNNQK